MARIYISNDPSDLIIVSFLYDLLLVGGFKIIYGCRWHPDEKRWGSSKLNGMVEDFERFDEDKKPFRSDFA